MSQSRGAVPFLPLKSGGQVPRGGVGGVLHADDELLKLRVPRKPPADRADEKRPLPLCGGGHVQAGEAAARLNVSLEGLALVIGLEAGFPVLI